MKNIFNIVPKITLSLVLFSTHAEAANPAEAKTIGRIVRERADLSKFMQLLEKTEEGSLLSEQSNKRRTVFAPTDKAFAKLSDAVVTTLLDPKNDDRLEEVFGFHVVTNSIPAFGLEKYATLRMSTGQFISVDYKNGKIGKARFTGEVIPCSNGVLYLIDTVLTPNTDDLFQTLQKDGRFSIFTKAITASRQGKLFQNMHGLYTTFAPTDEAFAKLPKQFVDSLFLPENNERLEDIIKHHITNRVFGVGVIPGFLSLGVSDVTPFSAFGQQLNFKKKNEIITIDGSNIVQKDIPCANGIIHVIDSVIPPVESSLIEILKNDQRFSTLVELLQKTGLDVPVASSSQFTIYAPINDAWKKEPYKSLLTDSSNMARERLFGILARHVITGKHVSENPRPFNKLRTIHGAPIYLTRGKNESKISAISIVDADIEAFNGLVNGITEVIPDQMELPEGDISTFDAIAFIQESLEMGSKLYANNEFNASWTSYTARGYEFLTKFSQFLSNNEVNELKFAIKDDQPVFQLAAKAWSSRNAFRKILRSLETREDKILDLDIIQNPEKKRFGR